MPSLLSEIRSVNPNTLKLHPRNPRHGDVAAIKHSLTANRQFSPLVVQTSTNYVLAGNHTLKAARELGWQAIDVVFVDVDDDQAHRILLAANRTSELGGFDVNALTELLTALPDLVGTGYSIDDLTSLLDDLPDLSDFPEPSAPSNSKPKAIECPECGCRFAPAAPKTPGEARDA